VPRTEVEAGRDNHGLEVSILSGGDIERTVLGMRYSISPCLGGRGRVEGCRRDLLRNPESLSSLSVAGVL